MDKHCQSDDELLVLDNLLHKYSAKCRNSSMLQGFLTALVCQPTLLLPSQYMPIIFGQDLPVYDNIEEAQKFLAIVNNTWNNIAKTLNNKHPLSIIVYNDPEDNSSIKDWLEGFVMAVACSASDWSLLLADAKNGYYLTIITNLDLAYSEDKALEERDVASLQFAVFKMHEFFLQFRDYDKQNLQSKNGFKSKIGRNNPCICGSGKKYKNCCIDITMH